MNRFVPVVKREWPVYFLKDLMLMKCTGDVESGSIRQLSVYIQGQDIYLLTYSLHAAESFLRS